MSSPWASGSRPPWSTRSSRSSCSMPSSRSSTWSSTCDGRRQREHPVGRGTAGPVGPRHRGARPALPVRRPRGSRQPRPDRDARRGPGRGRRVRHRQVGPAQHHHRPAQSGRRHSHRLRTGAQTRLPAALERSWGVLFQGGALFSNLTVRENIAAPMFEHTKLSRREAYELAELKISMVGLRPEAGSLKPAELSGGMRKRAGLARALALDPELLFLDEPTSGLDPIGAAAFDDLIRELADTMGLTVFLITHDLDSLYATCDRVAVLAEKKVIAIGTIPELLATEHPWIQDYFNGPRGRAAASGNQTAQRR